MITIQINIFTKIKNYIDEKYDELFYYNSFKSGTTLSITDENNQLYGLINDDIDIPLFIPNKDLGIASETFMKFLEYRGINSCEIKFNDEVKTIYQNKPKLKIERYDVDDVENFDFSIILVKDEALIHKGKKLQQDYIDKNDDVIVTKYYEDIIGDRIIYGKVISNRIIGLQVHIVWWTENNEIGLEKTVEVKKFSRQEEGERIKNYRIRQIANLKGMAMGTDAEQVVDIIYDYYDDEVYKYINHGTGEFLSALTYETDPTINYYLNIEIPNINVYDLEETDFYLSGGSYYYDDKITYDNCIARINDVIVCELIVEDVEIDIEVEEKEDFYKIKILDEDFTPTDNRYIIKYNNIIRDYIEHEINDDIL